MEGVIITIVGGILLRLIFPEPLVLSKSGEPEFLRNIPPVHYVGISREHHSLTEAKEEAVLDAIKQIFLKIGSEYRLDFNKTMLSINKRPQIKVLDNFNIGAGGVITDIEVRKVCVKKRKHRYVVYVLVFFPESRVKQARVMIQKESEKRMAQFQSFIDNGKQAQVAGQLEEALRQYRFALDLTDDLFTGKRSYKMLTESHINDVVELIRLREQRLRELRSRKPKLRVSPLSVTDNCFAFEVAELNGVGVEFDKYEVYINARYRNAKFINYYIAKVDRQKKASRTFDFIKPVKVDGNTSRIVMIPLNRWVKEKMDDFTSIVLGSQIDYQVVLHSGALSLAVR